MPFALATFPLVRQAGQPSYRQRIVEPDNNPAGAVGIVWSQD
jgi:hypothetical protein